VFVQKLGNTQVLALAMRKMLMNHGVLCHPVVTVVRAGIMIIAPLDFPNTHEAALGRLEV